MTITNNVLLTDLYQLTMMQAYHDNDMHGIAAFEFFARKLPANRGFLLAAGLEQVLDYLENLHFTDEDLHWARRSGFFTDTFVNWLGDLRFTGDVDAMPEGTAFFPDQPVLRVVAPIPEAQLVESRIVNLLHFQSLIATKAARCVLAAPGKQLVDFGFRRAHGAEAGLLAARASYLAGFDGTATVLAAPEFGIPVFGTMAHSFVQAHDDEMDSMERFAHSQPNNVVLLIDTYDTEAAAEKVVSLASRLRQQGIAVKAVRLDSGDLADHAFKVRRILNDGGCEDIRIFCSGGLDEFFLQDMTSKNAPIDGFGIGTRLDTSNDAPYLDCAYKLVEYAGIPRRKRSEGKATWPGRKQVYRLFDSERRMRGDVLALAGEHCEGTGLLQPVMRGGDRLQKPETPERIRQRVEETLESLPGKIRSLTPTGEYPVAVSPGLSDMTRQLDSRSFKGLGQAAS
jgi:nicotinate phosphoribosyltransferase